MLTKITTYSGIIDYADISDITRSSLLEDFKKSNHINNFLNNDTIEIFLKLYDFTIDDVYISNIPKDALYNSELDNYFISFDYLTTMTYTLLRNFCINPEEHQDKTERIIGKEYTTPNGLKSYQYFLKKIHYLSYSNNFVFSTSIPYKQSNPQNVHQEFVFSHGYNIEDNRHDKVIDELSREQLSSILKRSMGEEIGNIEISYSPHNDLFGNCKVFSIDFRNTDPKVVAQTIQYLKNYLKILGQSLVFNSYFGNNIMHYMRQYVSQAE